MTASDTRPWRDAVLWADHRVDDKRLLLHPEPGNCAGRPVVVRTPNAVALVRVERSDIGSLGRVHPSLARTLHADGERFKARWRPARWYDLVSRTNRRQLLILVLTLLAGVAAAALALPDAAKKVGWVLASVVLAVGVLLVALKAHKEWKELLP